MSDSLIDFVYLFSYRGDINQIAQQVSPVLNFTLICQMFIFYSVHSS